MIVIGANTHKRSSLLWAHTGAVFPVAAQPLCGGISAGAGISVRRRTNALYSHLLRS
jgi:hypothetical protein